jgi:very-short-patch-repair endonuclease
MSLGCLPFSGNRRTHRTVPLEQIRDALTDIGCNAVASHRSSALLWDLLPEHDIIDVVVSRAHRPRPRPGVVIHRATNLADHEVSVRHGVRCTNPLRTLADLGAVEPDAVATALTNAAVTRLVIPTAAAAVLDRMSVRGRPGLGPLRAALDDWPSLVAEPDSELEVIIGRLLRDANLQGFGFHPLIEGFEVDFAHCARRVILEADGFEFHSSRAAFENDRLRDATLAAAGWLVVRVTWWQVTEHPGEVIDRLRRTLWHREAG